MNLFAALAKHGIAPIVGFLAGLVAVAIIEPVTANGKILAIVTVMCLAVVLTELTRLAARLLRRPSKRNGTGNEGDGPEA
jgi:hypothetical protein